MIYMTCSAISRKQNFMTTDLTKGGDAKYGRLFTEDDVQAILRVAGADDGLETALHNLAYSGYKLRFDGDEPLFLLLGRDKAVVPTLHGYLDHSAAAGSPAAHIAAVNEQIERFEDWQATHPDVVDAPD